MQDPQTDTAYDANIIFRDDGPFDPMFMADAVQTVMRSVPIDQAECPAAERRHRNFAMAALAATNPRDAIELMLAVQAVCAYYAAGAAWRVANSMGRPDGSGARHISAAATASRTFDTMLRALERRQAKPLAAPVARPASRVWAKQPDPAPQDVIAHRILRANEEPVPKPISPPPDVDADADAVVWTPEAVALVDQMAEQARFDEENAGLDLANTEGIQPGGGIIMPEYPTPNQEKYIARRLGLMYKREYAENLRKGIKRYPKIRPLRTGDFIP